MHASRFFALLLLAVPLAAQPAPVKEAFGEFRADAIRAHTRFLSSDLLEGRGPGTRGDAITTLYLASQLEALGLEPAGDDGTFFQKVSLLGVTTKEDASSLSFVKDGKTIGPLAYRDQYVGTTPSSSSSGTASSPPSTTGTTTRTSTSAAKRS